MSFFSELSRRNVLRVAAAYIVVAWLIVQAVVTLRELFSEMPDLMQKGVYLSYAPAANRFRT